MWSGPEPVCSNIERLRMSGTAKLFFCVDRNGTLEGKYTWICRVGHSRLSTAGT